MSIPFPEPTDPAASRAEVFARYLSYFRAQLVVKLRGMGADELRRSRLPSGWTPLELLKHLTYVELRWLEWGFEGRAVADPWGDNDRDGRWHVAPDETLDGLVAALQAQAARSERVIAGHQLDEAGPAGRAVGRRAARDLGADPVPPAPGVRPPPRAPGHRQRAGQRPHGRVNAVRPGRSPPGRAVRWLNRSCPC